MRVKIEIVVESPSDMGLFDFIDTWPQRQLRYFFENLLRKPLLTATEKVVSVKVKKE